MRDLNEKFENYKVESDSMRNAYDELKSRYEKVFNDIIDLKKLLETEKEERA